MLGQLMAGHAADAGTARLILANTRPGCTAGSERDYHLRWCPGLNDEDLMRLLGWARVESEQCDTGDSFAERALANPALLAVQGARTSPALQCLVQILTGEAPDVAACVDVWGTDLDQKSQEILRAYAVQRSRGHRRRVRVGTQAWFTTICEVAVAAGLAAPAPTDILDGLMPYLTSTQEETPDISNLLRREFHRQIKQLNFSVDLPLTVLVWASDVFPTAQQARLIHLAEAFRPLPTRVMSARARMALEGLTGDRSGRVRYDGILALASSALDIPTLTEALDVLLDGTQEIPSVALQALASNPNLPAHGMERLAASVASPHSIPTRHWLTLARRTDASPTTHDRLIQSVFDTVTDDSPGEMSNCRAALLANHTTRARALTRVSMQQYEHLLRASAHLSGFVANDPEEMHTAACVLTDYVAGRLGTQQSAWETFLGLSNQWSGTLEELTMAATAL